MMFLKFPKLARVPASNVLYAGTVPASKKLNAGTVPAYKKLDAGTLVNFPKTCSLGVTHGEYP